MKTKWLMAALLSLLATAASAQEKLQLKLPEGTRTVHVTTQVHQTMTIAGMNIETSVDASNTTRAVTGKPAADGTVRVTETTTAQALHLKIPGAELDVDSAKDGSGKTGNEMLRAVGEALRYMVGKSTTTVYDKDKHVAAIEGTQKLLDEAPPAVAGILRGALDPEVLKRAAVQSAAVLPDTPVKQGDKWQRTEVERLGGGQNFTFTRYYEHQGTVERGGRKLIKLAVFSPEVSYSQDPGSPIPPVTKSDLKVESTMGRVLFDAERGEVVERSDSSHITGTLTLSVNGMELPAKLDLTMNTSTTLE